MKRYVKQGILYRLTLFDFLLFWNAKYRPIVRVISSRTSETTNGCEAIV